MELPENILNARASYKRHTELIKNFINDNGGKTKCSRDWDFAPHLVLEHRAAHRIPEHINKILAKAIEKREVVAEHFRAVRKARRGKLSEDDLRHLSFIDRLVTIKRTWFPDATVATVAAGPDNDIHTESFLTKAFHRLTITPHRATSESVQKPTEGSTKEATVNELAHLERLTSEPGHTWWFRPPAEMRTGRVATGTQLPIPGAFTFHLNVKEVSVDIWHPYHPQPVVWSGSTSLNEAKRELRHYLKLRWPVRITVRDSRGSYHLTRQEICAFAYFIGLQSFSQYERGDSWVAMTPYVRDNPDGSFEQMVMAGDKFGTVTKNMARISKGLNMETCELFSSKETWECLHREPPSQRAFNIFKKGNSSAEIRTTGHNHREESIRGEGDQLKGILWAMKCRGEDVRLFGDMPYRELKDVEHVLDLFDDQGTLLF